MRSSAKLKRTEPALNRQHKSSLGEVKNEIIRLGTKTNFIEVAQFDRDGAIGWLSHSLHSQ